MATTTHSKLQKQMALAVLIIMHVVGLVGLNVERFRGDFIPLIWINLLFIFGIVMSLHSKWNFHYLYYVLGIFILGLGVEILGVRTHAIFGDYQYQGNMGLSIMTVQLVIGLNWVVLTYCAGTIARRVDPSVGIRIAVGALLMTGMDALIEPFAIRYDLWQWQAGHPPFQNYVGWFFTALIAQTAYHLLLARTTNPVAAPTFLILLLFFALDLLWS